MVGGWLGLATIQLPQPSSAGTWAELGNYQILREGEGVYPLFGKSPKNFRCFLPKASLERYKNLTTLQLVHKIFGFSLGVRLLYFSLRDDCIPS